MADMFVWSYCGTLGSSLCRFRNRGRVCRCSYCVCMCSWQIYVFLFIAIVYSTQVFVHLGCKESHSSVSLWDKVRWQVCDLLRIPPVFSISMDSKEGCLCYLAYPRWYNGVDKIREYNTTQQYHKLYPPKWKWIQLNQHISKTVPTKTTCITSCYKCQKTVF